ncbi:MAG: PQQ-binding-like beta-propeller repeat protein [Myxococcales bacterium]|nr:PQQ-binding-like beta-propeller repeat protein [Myxococcales bacterium]
MTWFGLWIGCVLFQQQEGHQRPAADDATVALAAPDEPTSTPEDLEWANALGQQGIPTEFRKGHATPRDLGSVRSTRTDDRFVVQLPNGAPVTTPAVHRGKVVFSGGFHGKEFYAVDARTGAPAWGVDLDDDGPSAPACADGICVFNTESCTIFALQAATGEHLWSLWMGDPMLAAPAIADGRVFTSYPSVAGTYGGPNGANLQQQQLTPPQPRGGVDPLPVHPDASHVIAALDLKTGGVLWQRRIDGDVLSSPVVVGDTVHLTTFSGSVFALNAEDGSVRSVVRGRATSAPTVNGGTVFWTTRSEAAGAQAKESLVRDQRGSGGGLELFNEKEAPYLDAATQQASSYSVEGTALDALNGFSSAPATAKVGAALSTVGRGSVATLQAFQGSRIAGDGEYNYATMGDEIIGTHATTGEELWRVKVQGDLQQGGSLATAPAVAGGRTVVGTLSGQVLVLDPATGKTVRSFEVGHPIRSQPVVSQGWIYVGTENGRIVGIDTGDPTLDGWTMWGRDAARTASNQ